MNKSNNHAIDNGKRREFDAKMDKHLSAIEKLMKEYGILEYETGTMEDAKFKTHFIRKEK